MRRVALLSMLHSCHSSMSSDQSTSASGSCISSEATLVVAWQAARARPSALDPGALKAQMALGMLTNRLCSVLTSTSGTCGRACGGAAPGRFGQGPHLATLGALGLPARWACARRRNAHTKGALPRAAPPPPPSLTCRLKLWKVLMAAMHAVKASMQVMCASSRGVRLACMATRRTPLA
jgi:hypothetical protein